MGKNIVIRREVDKLTYEEFGFYSLDDTLWFNNYYRYQKENGRKKKHDCVAVYERLGFRHNSGRGIAFNEVPLTPEIMEEARQEYIKNFECKIWKK